MGTPPHPGASDTPIDSIPALLATPEAFGQPIAITGRLAALVLRRTAKNDPYAIAHLADTADPAATVAVLIPVLPYEVCATALTPGARLNIQGRTMTGHAWGCRVLANTVTPTP